MGRHDAVLFLVGWVIASASGSALVATSYQQICTLDNAVNGPQ
jgi:hypothetical protein